MSSPEGWDSSKKVTVWRLEDDATQMPTTQSISTLTFITEALGQFRLDQPPDCESVWKTRPGRSYDHRAERFGLAALDDPGADRRDRAVSPVYSGAPIATESGSETPPGAGKTGETAAVQAADNQNLARCTGLY